VPLSSITHFSVDGDLYLNHVSWGGKYYPVPFESGIATGFAVGKRLIIHGAPEKKVCFHLLNIFNCVLRQSVSTSTCYGRMVTSHCTVCQWFKAVSIISVNPRFDEKNVCRNSLQAGEWYVFKPNQHCCLGGMKNEKARFHLRRESASI
jgi:hypothetical protein